ncbi:hypothetical protein [Thalassoglobus polymorphus]|uniref:hypothetical protein n=1 Tax=Thalassoglobus polymorphus TaxID=2527994 RepID=UPI0011A2A215|nr:hypothetical protein [Thalassoglobus polymorphus]
MLQTEDRNIEGVKSCESCKARTEPAAEAVNVDEIAIIAVHFNPERYHLPVRNYFEWRHSLGRMERNLITVELSFDGHFTIHDSIKLHGGPLNVLWQKERMINIGLQHLPDHVKYVAWIDHDMVFDNQSWPEDAIKLLQTLDVVQLFETMTYLDNGRSETSTRIGAVAGYLGEVDKKNTSAPGGAWMARRDYLERCGGILDDNIVGGGDNVLCDGWLGRQSHYMQTYAGKLAESARSWQMEARQGFRGVGFVPGDAKHLFHGGKANRQYMTRAGILRRHDFDPSKDLVIDSAGLWSFRPGHKEDMQKEIAEYFAGRKEDDFA